MTAPSVRAATVRALRPALARLGAVGVLGVVFALAALLAMPAGAGAVALPTLAIANASPLSVAEGDAGTQTVSLPVTLSSTPATNVTVRFATMLGSATAGADYAYRESTLSFGAGTPTLTQDIVVTVNGDTTPESNENFFVQLYSESGATLGTRFGQAVIANDDAAAPALSVASSPNPITEGDAGTAPVTFTIALSATPSGPVTYKYATNYGTATANLDYVYNQGTGTFAAGASGPDLSQIVTVAVNGDTTPEADETFFLQLYDIGGATAPSPFGPAAIQNDDAPVPAIAIADGAGVRGADAVFAVTLSVSPSSAVSVKYATMPGSYYDTTAAPGVDFTAQSGTLSWASGASGAALTQNVTVALLGEATPTSEIFYVQIYDPVGATLAAQRYGQGTIAAANAPPVANADTFSAVGNTKLAVGVSVTGEPVKSLTGPTASVTANDTDPENDALTVTAGATSASGGSVAMNPDGTFIYVPAVAFTGADSFTYSLDDGFGNTVNGTVNVTVSDLVWYVDNALAPPGDGRSTTPFNSLAPLTSGGSANSLDGVGDVIFVYQGSASYGGGIVLEASQRLTGQPEGLVVGADTLLAAGGNNPVVTNSGNGAAGINLAQDNVIRRVDVASTGGDGITGTGISNADVGPNTSITNTTGTGFALSSNGAGTITFDASISEGPSNGRPVSIANRTGGSVDISGAITGNGTGISFSTNAATINLTGLVTMSTGANPALTISDAGTANVTVQPASGTNSFATTTANTVDINGGDGNITIDGTIAQSNGSATSARAVSVQNHIGGTIAFPKNVTSANGIGVVLSSNAGCTINFTGGAMALSTGGSNGFTATNGGTVNVTGTDNTVTTTTGVAVTMVNTTIGASNVTFKTVTAGTSAGGPSSGIVLNATGSSGGLKVTGSGSADSGGIIQKTTGPGISLASTTGPSFDRMNIQNTIRSGVQGVDGQITDFSFTNGTINNSGSASSAGSNIAFAGDSLTSVSGVVTITGNTLTNAYRHGVDILNVSGTISHATISNNIITSTTSTATSNGSGIQLQAFGNASTVANVTKATIDGNVITNFPQGFGVNAQGGNSNASGPAGVFGLAGDATNVVAITNNRIAGASPAIRMGVNAIFTYVVGKGTGNFNISGNGTVANPITNVASDAISTRAEGAAVATSTISNNRIVANIGSAGIRVRTALLSAYADAPSLTTTISGNTVSGTSGNGIHALAADATGTLRVKIQSNTVGAPLTSGQTGIRVESGSGFSVNDSVCANISGNTSAGNGTSGIGLRKQGTSPTTNAFAIHGMAATSTPAVQTYVNGLNPAGNGTVLLSATSGFTNCSLP